MAQNGLFGTPFLTPTIPLEKVYVGPFLRPFPGSEAHELFSGSPKRGVLGGGQQVDVDRVFMCFFLGGPNGLLPLAHENRAVTESFGKSEIPGPKHLCDLSRKLPRHGNSDHLMSFKGRSFPRFPFL